MKLNEALSKRLGELLKENGTTPYRLSKEGGLQRSTLAAILAKRNRSTTLDTINQICSCLGMNLKDFFDDPIFINIID